MANLKMRQVSLCGGRGGNSGYPALVNDKLKIIAVGHFDTAVFLIAQTAVNRQKNLSPVVLGSTACFKQACLI